MRAIQLFTSGFVLAAALFVATMLAAPPTSEAAAEGAGPGAAPTPLELVGP